MFNSLNSFRSLLLLIASLAAFFTTTLATNQATDCFRTWPELELFVPIKVNNPSDRTNEWRDILFKTLFLFWPLQLSKTKLLVLIDEEDKNKATDLQNQLKQHQSFFYSKEIGVKYNNYPSSVYHENGHTRQQLMMMEADLYSDSEYIGFVDTDCCFIAYVDREDLFEDGKPVVNARVGLAQNSWWKNVPKSTVWLMGGLNVTKEPFRCMSYFPIIVKRSHLKDMRAYFMKVHSNRTFHEIFKEYSSANTFSQFNAICAYLWNFKREEYAWYASYTDTYWPAETPYSLSSFEARQVFPPSMWQPKPRIAIHNRYHHKIMSEKSVLLESICTSPPFPKPYLKLDSYCNNKSFSITYNSRYPHHSDGYSFETGHFNHYNQTDLNKVALDRHNRIKNCNHTWHTELLPQLHDYFI